jgi:aryl-alcohol dehydrogenase-like predicted oxidoreductase
MYMLHWADPFVPLVDTWSTMCELVDVGLVRCIGVSNFDRDLVERCHALRRVDFVEVELSMLNRDSAELISWCSANGVGVLTYGSLGYGLLSGARRSAPANDAAVLYRGLFDEAVLPARLVIVDAIAEIGRELGCTPGQLALAWAAHQRGVTSVLSGSREPRHIQENAQAGDLHLTEAVLLRINEKIDGDV